MTNTPSADADAAGVGTAGVGTQRAGRYRKRSTLVRAMRYTGDNLHRLWDEFGAAGIYGPTETNPDWLLLTTIQGRQVPCGVGEWVVEEPVIDRFYPVADEVFTNTYDPEPNLQKPTTDISLMRTHLIKSGFAHPDGVVVSWPDGRRGEETAVEHLALALLNAGWTHPDIVEGHVRS